MLPDDEQLLLFASVYRILDPEDTRLIAAYQRLAGQGYTELHFKHDTMSAEQRFYLVAVTLTDEGKREVERIKAENGIS